MMARDGKDQGKDSELKIQRCENSTIDVESGMEFNTDVVVLHDDEN